MTEEEQIGKTVVDTDVSYEGDVGVVFDVRHFKKANKKYLVVRWGQGTKHGECFRNYKPEEIGNRLKVVN